MDDQKKTVTALAIYPVCYIAGAVLYHSLRGNIDWTDILWRSAWSTVVAVLIAVFFIMGSKTPKKQIFLTTNE